MKELVDYSRTASSDWAGLARTLKLTGKAGVGRYVVDDVSPYGRGITAAEYAAMREEGLDVFVYWESSAAWMLGGYSAGVQAAENAVANLKRAGMPESTPVYFACDFDAEPSHQSAIDECLRGAASVIGKHRVGLYAGYHVLKRSRDNGAATWLCQTSAWSGGMLLDGVHLYQYAYNQYFGGTNCDLVRAYADNYGQANPPRADPPAPGPEYPVGMTYELARERFGKLVVTFDGVKYDLHFDPDGPISRAWLKMIADQLKPGESYHAAVVGPITKVVRRGADKRYWDVVFTGMPTIRYDSETRTVVSP